MSATNNRKSHDFEDFNIFKFSRFLDFQISKASSSNFQYFKILSSNFKIPVFSIFMIYRFSDFQNLMIKFLRF